MQCRQDDLRSALQNLYTPTMMMEQRSRSVLVGQRLPAGTVYSLKPCLRRKTSPPCHLLDGMKCVSIRKSCSRLMMLWLGLEQCSLTPSTQRHPYLRVSRIHCLFATLSKLCSNYISVYLLVASVQLSFVLFSLFLVLSLSLSRSLSLSLSFSIQCHFFSSLLASLLLSVSLSFLSLSFSFRCSGISRCKILFCKRFSCVWGHESTSCCSCYCLQKRLRLPTATLSFVC